jgi:hypothetical protein
MKKLIITALVATFATLAAAGSASALPNKDVLDAIINSLKKGKSTESTSPGDAFYPDTQVADPLAGCAAAGGTAKRRFEGDGFVWTCVH